MASRTEVLEQMSLALAYVLQNQDAFSDAQALQVSAIYPEWHVGVDYRVGQVCRYQSQIYRCVQAHASQASWAPDAAPSLWDAVTIDPATGYDVWQQPSGAHDAYNVGDRVLYPDASGQVYESVINGNTWSPDAYPAGWKVVDGDAA